MPTKDLFDESLDIRKGLAVGVRWKAVSSYDGINFRLSFLLNFRIERHGQEECMYGRNTLTEGAVNWPRLNGFDATHCVSTA